MKKGLLSIALAGIMVAGVLGAVAASAQEADPPAASDGPGTTFFMRRDGCGGDADNPRLSIEDGEDVDCGFTDNSLGDVYAEVFDPAELFPSVDGVPLVLDGTRPVTGVITIRSWNGAGGGLAELDLELLGEAAGEQKVLGSFSTSYQAAPAGAYTFEYEMEPQSDLNGLSFDSLTLRVFTHGATVGRHGFIEFDEPPSTVTVPTIGGSTVGEIPTDDVVKEPKKLTKKQCKKIKNKKKRKRCLKKLKAQNKKPEEPATEACPAYTPGEEGAEAETLTITDSATEEEPVIVEFDGGVGMGAPIIGGVPVPPDQTTHTYHNVQVDSANPEAGLYVRLDFAEFRDYDLYLRYPDGTEGTHSGDFNAIGPPVFTCGGEGCSSGADFEQVGGIRTADCGGWTIDSVAFLTEGGDVTLSMWLGEIQHDPAAPGGGARSALELMQETLK